MNIFYRSCLISLLVLAPPTALACAILSESKQIQVDADEREEMTRMVRDLAAQATHIFVARVVGVEEANEERIVEGERLALKVFHPELKLLKSVKGSGETGNLFWEEGQDRIVVSCRYTAYFNRINLIPTYRYLVYAIGREIARAEVIMDWPMRLTIEEELALIRAEDGE